MVGGVTYCKEAKQPLQPPRPPQPQGGASQSVRLVGENESPGHFAPSVHYYSVVLLPFVGCLYGLESAVAAQYGLARRARGAHGQQRRRRAALRSERPPKAKRGYRGCHCCCVALLSLCWGCCCSCMWVCAMEATQWWGRRTGGTGDFDSSRR